MSTTHPQIAVNAEAEAMTARAEVAAVKFPSPVGSTTQSDHFVERNGLVYAGSHLIVDLWQANGLDDVALIEQALRRAVDAAKATLLHIHLHKFSPEGGVSGVAVLAESHISIHTWPERGYAALDVFMCGDAEPERAIPVLREAFEPGRVIVSEHKRGVV